MDNCEHSRHRRQGPAPARHGVTILLPSGRIIERRLCGEHAEWEHFAGQNGHYDDVAIDPLD